MLGKQAWKLITHPESLLARMVKAKYFPTGSFLTAHLGHNPSYTWRSLHSTQNLLKLGYRWRVGDGSNINIWEEPWLHSTPPHRIVAPGNIFLDHLNSKG